MALVVFAALELGACGSGRDEDRDGGGNGISADVAASDETRQATGVVAWRVVDIGARSLSVTALGSGDATIAEMIATHGDTIVIEVADTDRRIVLDGSGNVLESSLSLDDIAIFERFRLDALAKLEDDGFRDWADCMGAVAGAAMDCASYYMQPSPDQLMECASNTWGAGQTCWNAYTGQEETGSTSGGSGETTAGTAGESGQGESGQGESGQGESGQGESGQGESGYGDTYGSGGQTGDSGYGESGQGGENGGSAEEGYGEEGYGEEGYGGEGYGYSLPDPNRWRAPSAMLAIPDGSAATGFAEQAVPTGALHSERWNLGAELQRGHAFAS